MPKTERHDRFSDLDTLPYEQLELLLKKELLSEEDNPELVGRVLEVMKRKRPEAFSDPARPVDALWQDFQKHYVPAQGTGQIPMPFRKPVEAEQKTRKSHRSIKLLASMAAVLALVLFTVPQVSGFTDIWEMFVEWTDEVFSFSNRYEEEHIKDAMVDPTSLPAFTDLQDALDVYGVTVPLAPTWVPEGYEVFDVRVEEKKNTKKKLYSSAYQNDFGDIMTIMVYEFHTSDSQMSERDEVEHEVYYANEIAHYIFENNGRVVVSWYYDHYEGYISSCISREEIKAMIDSIYERMS